MISTEEDIFGEYSAGNAAIFHRDFLTLGKAVFPGIQDLFSV